MIHTDLHYKDSNVPVKSRKKNASVLNKIDQSSDPF